MSRRILIAGGGVAALEAGLALTDLAGDRVRVELLARDPVFVYRALAVGEPFGLAESPRYDLAAIAADRGWTLSIGTLASVDPARREARTAAGAVHAYSALVLALGAVPVPALPGALTFTGPADAERLADALRTVKGHIAFVAVDPGWTLPLYELALAALGIALRTASVATEAADGAVHIELEGPLRADLAVALPRLRGPALPGIPDAEHGFVAVDAFGRVEGAPGVFAVGDMTTRVLRGMLLTGALYCAAAPGPARRRRPPRASRSGGRRTRSSRGAWGRTWRPIASSSCPIPNGGPVTPPILIAVDPTRQDGESIVLGGALAAATGAPVVVAAVYHHERLPTRSGVVIDSFDRERRAEAEAAVRAVAAGLGAETRVVGASSPARGLQGLAEELEPAILVLGSTHRGRVGRVLIGGTAEHLLHGAPCPVAVAPRGLEAGAVALRRIGVGFLDTEDGHEALQGAVALARRLGARLWMLAVDEQPPYTSSAIAPGYGSPELERIVREERRADLERAAATVPDGTVAEALLLDGPAGRALAAASEDLDLLVCGSRGYGAVGSVLLGSVSHHLVRTAACPLLVVPRDGAAALERLAGSADAALAG